MKILRLLVSPFLRDRYRSQATQQQGAVAAEKALTGRYHCCPRCTEMLPRNPVKIYYYCPLCGYRVDYPEHDGYGLQVVTTSDLSQHIRLVRAAEQVSLALGGGDR